MAITGKILVAGQKPSKEEMARIRAELAEARKRPIVFDEDCPELTPQQLAEFHPVGMTWEERNKSMAERRSKSSRLTSIR
jgi:hypothetical protein